MKAVMRAPLPGSTNALAAFLVDAHRHGDAACYAGGIADREMVPAELSRVYAFLRAALRAVTAESPYRGPASYRRGDLLSLKEPHGTVECSGVSNESREGKPRCTRCGTLEA